MKKKLPISLSDSEFSYIMLRLMEQKMNMMVSEMLQLHDCDCLRKTLNKFDVSCETHEKLIIEVLSEISKKNIISTNITPEFAKKSLVAYNNIKEREIINGKN